MTCLYISDSLDVLWAYSPFIHLHFGIPTVFAKVRRTVGPVLEAQQLQGDSDKTLRCLGQMRESLASIKNHGLSRSFGGKFSQKYPKNPNKISMLRQSEQTELKLCGILRIQGNLRCKFRISKEMWCFWYCNSQWDTRSNHSPLHPSIYKWTRCYEQSSKQIESVRWPNVRSDPHEASRSPLFTEQQEFEAPWSLPAVSPASHFFRFDSQISH